jgi:hypothetical protein
MPYVLQARNIASVYIARIAKHLFYLVLIVFTKVELEVRAGIHVLLTSFEKI